jgi:hypothetical protein
MACKMREKYEAVGVSQQSSSCSALQSGGSGAKYRKHRMGAKERKKEQMRNADIRVRCQIERATKLHRSVCYIYWKKKLDFGFYLS